MGNSKNFPKTLKSLAFFNILVEFFLGDRMVALGFIRIENHGFCVFGFLNVSEVWKILRILKSWFLSKISNFFKILRFKSLVDLGTKHAKNFPNF